MANRETFPANLSPLQGDVSALAGAKQVTVVGLQTVPVDTTVPADQNVLRYYLSTGKWEIVTPTDTAIFINGIPASDDYLVYVNSGALIKVNGV